MSEFHDRRTGDTTDPAAHLYGHEDTLDAMFPAGAPKVGVPWQQMTRRRDIQDYDKGLVHEALRQPINEHTLVPIDPRNLRASQPSLHRAGVQHYLGDTYRKTGMTFADQGNVGNRHPVVYSRSDPAGGEPQNIILSGHHRFAAGLLKGEAVPARHIEGGWGPKR